MYQTEDLLIITKTYPLPSRDYIEHTCCVAINAQGQLRRLFPVPYRLLDQNKQFARWQWIRANLKRSSDVRPESFRVDLDSIQLLDRIEPEKDWGRRLQWIDPLCSSSFSELEAKRLEAGTSLGFVRAVRPKLEITPEKEPEWTPNEKNNLMRNTFFTAEDVRSRPLLKKVPYVFHYRYECETSTGVEANKHMVTDWEIGMLFWNCHDSHQDNWEQPFRQKLEEDFSRRNLIFVLGTMYNHRHQWLIAGVIYPPRLPGWQPALLPSRPDE